MKNYSYLNLEVIRENKKLQNTGKILFDHVDCKKMSAEVFQRYTDILIGIDQDIKGADYDLLINEFVDLKERMKGLHKIEDDEMFLEYNLFAREQCKIIYQEFYNKAFDSEL
jgi:hypothetical protein